MNRPLPVTPRGDSPIERLLPDGERPKTITKGTEKVELRRLTPEERAQRRRTRNLIMGVSFILILFIVFIVLLKIG